MSTATKTTKAVPAPRQKQKLSEMTDDQFLTLIDEYDHDAVIPEEIQKESDRRRVGPRFGEYRDNHIENREIRAERLRVEIENLKLGILNTRALIKHDPYKEDLPGLRKGLEQWLDMLESAKNDFNEFVRLGKTVIFEH